MFNMRLKNLTVIFAAAVCLAVSASAATIQFTTTALPGVNQFHYNYLVSGSLAANQALDLMFPAALYANLANPLVGPGITPIVLQPNNPPGVAGDFTLYASSAIASLSGTFGIDFTFLGTGTPGAQPYSLDTFNADGFLVSSVSQGNTMPAGTPSVPEPAGFALCLIGLLAGGGKWASRRFLGTNS